MTRSLEDSLRWVRAGTSVLVEVVARLDEAAWDAPTLLPGWSRRQLVAHVASNARALSNLLTWAATGVPTPMYASADERARGIERGLAMSGEDLCAWLRRTAAELEEGMAGLDEARWGHEVTTAQGRAVPATEIPWLRAREVLVHTVDLDDGTQFADLPEDFLAALEADVVAKRGEVPAVVGPLPERVAWLTGRPHALGAAPALEPWL